MTRTVYIVELPCQQAGCDAYMEAHMLDGKLQEYVKVGCHHHQMPKRMQREALLAIVENLGGDDDA